MAEFKVRIIHAGSEDGPPRVYHCSVKWQLNQYTIRYRDTTYTTIHSILTFLGGLIYQDVLCLIQDEDGTWTDFERTLKGWRAAWMLITLQQCQRNTAKDPTLVAIEGFRRVDLSPSGYEFFCVFQEDVSIWLHHSYLVENTQMLDMLVNTCKWNHKNMATMYTEDVHMTGQDDSLMHTFEENIRLVKKNKKYKKRKPGQSHITTFFSA